MADGTGHAGLADAVGANDPCKWVGCRDTLLTGSAH